MGEGLGDTNRGVWGDGVRKREKGEEPKNKGCLCYPTGSTFLLAMMYKWRCFS